MKFWYIYSSKYLHGTWSLLNILMIFGINDKSIILTHKMFFGYCYKLLKTAFVLQGHIYFLPYSVIQMDKNKSVSSIYTDCTIITIWCCPAVYFFLSQLKVRDNNCFVNYTYINIIILILIINTFDISIPLTSEMIAIPLPCNITEYKTLAISMLSLFGHQIFCSSTRDAAINRFSINRALKRHG